MSSQPVPRWFRDPGHSDQERWWDGTTWTQQVRKVGPQPRGPERGVDPETGMDTHLLEESAFWIFTDRVDGQYTQEVDGGAIAAHDETRRRSHNRQFFAACALGLLALVAGPVLVIIVPVAIVVFLLVWAIRGGSTVKQRQALTRWAEARGLGDDGGMLLFGDKATQLPAGDPDEAMRGLRAAGMRFRGLGRARIRGRLWRAAPNATIQSVQGLSEFRNDMAAMTIVSVPLPPEVAIRYRGVAAEIPNENRRRKLQLDAWESVPYAPEDGTPPSHVTAHPEQLAPRDLVLLGVPVLERVKHLWGWVVTDGRLTAWILGDLLAEVAARQLLIEQRKDPGDFALAEDRMVQFLRNVSDLHEVVLGAA
ncbi:MAG: hypothetical protein JWL76_1839 [Thermoleophilia bacterium]|nr:hypothetical protein [Thermoleophilia bacterium]